MITKSITAMAILCFVSPTIASLGNDVGNGGNVVVCPHSTAEQSTVELLDFVEAKNLRGISINLGAPSLSTAEKINIALDRLALVSPSTASRYRQEAKNFLLGEVGDPTSSALFLPGIEMIQIPDSEHAFIPAGCHAEQIVRQHEPQFPEDKLFLVSRNLWDRLDSTNRAGLILHELLYRDYISHHYFNSPVNSVTTRYLNSYISSGKILDLDQKHLFNLLEQTRVFRSFIANKKVECIDQSFYESDVVKTCTVKKGTPFSINDKIYSIKETVEFNEQGNVTKVSLTDPSIFTTQLGDLLSKNDLTLFNNGQIRTLSLKADTELNKGQLFGHPVEFWGSIQFFENGLPAIVTFMANQILDLPFFGRTIKVASGSTGFDNEGNVLVGCIVSPTYFKSLSWQNTYSLNRPNTKYCGTSFFEGGILKEAIGVKGEVLLKGQKLCVDGSIKLTKNGYPLSVDLCTKKGLFDSDSIALKVNGKDVFFLKGKTISFYDNQEVKEGKLAKDTSFVSFYSGTRKCVKGSNVELTEEGKLVSCW